MSQANTLHLTVEQAFTHPAPFLANYAAVSGQNGVGVSLISSTATGSPADSPDSDDLSAVTIVIIAGASLVFIVVASLAVRHFCCTSGAGRRAGSKAMRDDGGDQGFAPMTEMTGVVAGANASGKGGSGAASPSGEVGFINPVNASPVAAAAAASGARGGPLIGEAGGAGAKQKKKKSSRERRARAYDDGL